MTSTPSILAEARDEASLVRIRSRFAEELCNAFAIDVERDLALLLTLDQGFHLDGLRVLRSADLVECDFPHPHSAFIEEVLRLRGEDEIELPGLSIESWESLLETASQHLPLVSLYRDEIEGGTALDGRVMEVDENRVLLLGVDGDAKWAEEPISLDLADLTRVDLGGSRLEAVYLVCGEPD